MVQKMIVAWGIDFLGEREIVSKGKKFPRSSSNVAF